MRAYIQIPLFILAPVVAIAWLVGALCLVGTSIAGATFLIPLLSWTQDEMTWQAMLASWVAAAALIWFTIKFTTWSDDNDGEPSSTVMFGVVFYILLGIAAAVTYRVWSNLGGVF